MFNLGKSRRLFVVAALLATALLGVRFGPYLLARLGVPVTYSEADLDHDGWVSVSEALYLADAGTRSVARVGRQSCIEYFALKDGQPIKTVCK